MCLRILWIGNIHMYWVFSNKPTTNLGVVIDLFIREWATFSLAWEPQQTVPRSLCGLSWNKSTQMIFLVSLKHSFQTIVESSALFCIGYIAFRKSNCEENSSRAKGRDSLPRLFLLKIITLGREAALSKYPESFPSPFYMLKFMFIKNL